MRKKLLSNNEITSISKGGILYRPGEIPVLTKSQAEQAKLVAKLPQDFPIANWENMGTKQQLQQMKYSGLNAQEQWSLLNSNVPLTALSQYNQAQTQNASVAYANSVATALAKQVVAATVPRAQANVNNSTNSTALQNNPSSGKLDEQLAATRDAIRNGASSRDLMEQRKDKLWNKIPVNPVKQKTPQATPSPTKTPPSKTPEGNKPIFDSRDAMEQKKDRYWDKIVVPTWREKREDEIWEPVKSSEKAEPFPEFNLFNVTPEQPVQKDNNEGGKPNSKIIEMFNYGYEQPPQLKDGEFYYVEETAVFGGVTSIAIGRVILFNEDKYAVYNYIGFNAGVSLVNIPYNHIWSRGVVSNVYDVGDYEGSFLNGSSVTGPIGYSQSVGRNSRGDMVISRSDGVEELFPTGSASASYQWYASQSDHWIEDTAPIEWADTVWDNFLNPHPYEV